MPLKGCSNRKQHRVFSVVRTLNLPSALQLFKRGRVATTEHIRVPARGRTRNVPACQLCGLVRPTGFCANGRGRASRHWIKRETIAPETVVVSRIRWRTVWHPISRAYRGRRGFHFSYGTRSEGAVALVSYKGEALSTSRAFSRWMIARWRWEQKKRLPASLKATPDYLLWGDAFLDLTPEELAALWAWGKTVSQLD